MNVLHKTAQILQKVLLSCVGFPMLDSHQRYRFLYLFSTFPNALVSRNCWQLMKCNKNLDSLPKQQNVFLWSGEYFPLNWEIYSLTCTYDKSCFLAKKGSLPLLVLKVPRKRRNHKATACQRAVFFYCRLHHFRFTFPHVMWVLRFLFNWWTQQTGKKALRCTRRENTNRKCSRDTNFRLLWYIAQG